MTTAERIFSVLIVDDDRDIVAILTEVLATSGFSVVQAKDGIDALSYLYATRPDIVLVDLMMPRMNGIELITQIRNDRRLSGMPIIAMSAAPSLLPSAKEAGANEVIAKPLGTDALLLILERHRPRSDRAVAKAR